MSGQLSYESRRLGAVNWDLCPDVRALGIEIHDSDRRILHCTRCNNYWALDWAILIDTPRLVVKDSHIGEDPNTLWWICTICGTLKAIDQRPGALPFRTPPEMVDRMLGLAPPGGDGLADVRTTPDQPGYIVRRKFDPGGLTFEPGEVVLKGIGRWHFSGFFNAKDRVINQGMLEKLPDGEPVWQCLCGTFATFWSTPDLAARHSCYGEQPGDETAASSSARSPDPTAAAADVPPARGSAEHDPTAELSERAMELWKLHREFEKSKQKLSPKVAAERMFLSKRHVARFYAELRAAGLLPHSSRSHFR